jgi:SAM-dependent methyltransferase
MIIPFSYPWIIRRHFNGAKTVLDVGSGDGAFMFTVNADKRYEVTGVELFDPYIKKARKLNIYQKIVKQDVRKIEYKNNSFEVVHSSQVVEHIKKEEGVKLIQKCVKIAGRAVIIGTPNGHFHQEEYDDNKLQEHHSEWDITDFRKLGFRVYGQGLKAVYGEHGLLHTPIGNFPIVKHALMAVSFVLSPIVYFSPHLAAHLIAVKMK